MSGSIKCEGRRNGIAKRPYDRVRPRFLVILKTMEFEERITKIEMRNKSVEADKAWETSLARRGLIALFTYIVVGIFLNIIAVSNPWIAALVPVIGFILSTLTIPFFKKMWINRFYR